MSWNDITYRQLQLLNAASEIQDETEKVVAVMQAVFGDDVIELPLAEYSKKASWLSFLNEKVPTSIKIKNVKVNDREYYFDGMLGNISTAQYIDF